MIFLDGLLVSASYKNEIIRRLVHNFKYRFVADIAAPLAEICLMAIFRSEIPLPDFIVPVPLHPRRLRWRGFNQSRLLAELISEKISPPLKIEVLDALQRKNFVRPQMKVANYRERFQNVTGNFRLSRAITPGILFQKRILLVDDIATTGATLFECARILKESGAKKVFAVVIARQSIRE